MTSRLKFLKNIFKSTSYLNSRNRSKLKFKSIKRELLINRKYEKCKKETELKQQRTNRIILLFCQSKFKQRSLQINLYQTKRKEWASICRTKQRLLKAKTNFIDLKNLMIRNDTNKCQITKRKFTFENLKKLLSLMKVQKKFDELLFMILQFLEK